MLQLTRRQALQLIIAATGAATFKNQLHAAQGGTRGLGFDPDLLKKEIPWSRVLTDSEKSCLAALVDVLLPSDELGPAATEIGVVDFIDEWVSAPYAPQQKDAKVIRDGLKWLDGRSLLLHQQIFSKISSAQQLALVTAGFTAKTVENREGFSFLRLVRDRAAGAYFTTQQGWKAIGYVGNVPITGGFPAPTAEALKHAGLSSED